MMKFVRMLYPRNVMTFTNRSAPRLQRKYARMFLVPSPNALQSTNRFVNQCLERFVKGWISTLSQNAEMSSTRNARMNPKRTAHTRRLSVKMKMRKFVILFQERCAKMSPKMSVNRLRGMIVRRLQNSSVMKCQRLSVLISRYNSVQRFLSRNVKINQGLSAL